MKQTINCKICNTEGIVVVYDSFIPIFLPNGWKISRDRPFKNSIVCDKCAKESNFKDLLD